MSTLSKEQTLFEKTGQQLENAVQSKLFGKPCFKINGKAFVCFFNKDMVFKLTGEAHAKALSFDGSQLFDPSGKGRPMKEWVQVPYEYKKHWLDFAQDALAYVKAIS